MDGRHLPCETSTTCTFVEWPERNYRAFHNQGSPRQALIWFGGLVDKMRDGSGYLYMRNRYYNPQTGTFTQEDPIGLAGGLNVYGFAGGDPVGYSDPFGLSACSDRVERGETCEEDQEGEGDVKRHDRCEVASILTNYVGALRSNPRDFADGTYPSEFDFKFGGTSDDLYQVGNEWLRADQFGNFAAGYAGQRAWGAAGHAAMIAGGIWFAIEKGSGEHWFDGARRPMINAGARRARLEERRYYNHTVSAPSVTALTSTAGCK